MACTFAVAVMVNAEPAGCLADGGGLHWAALATLHSVGTKPEPPPPRAADV
jgi:hypothetical protein